MKTADVLMLVIPADGGLDAEGERIVDAICMTGVPTTVGVLQGELPHKQQAANTPCSTVHLYAYASPSAAAICEDKERKRASERVRAR